MSMIDCCVFNYTKNRMILPWKIMSLASPGVTLKQFYEEKVVSNIHQSSASNLHLESAFLGQSKSSLDQIELSICLSTAILHYGGFLKYHVSEVLNGPLPARNAFTILMHSQYLLSQPSLPSQVQEQNNKDKMYNAVLNLLESRNLKFSSSEVSNVGKTFVKTLVDVLWYLDGHHETFSEQSCPIPSCFAACVGYNKPELSKHRKRQNTNMCCDTLHSLSKLLFNAL